MRDARRNTIGQGRRRGFGAILFDARPRWSGMERVRLDRHDMNRLHDKGMIHNPVGKAKSVLLTEEGIAESERLFREMFAETI